MNLSSRGAGGASQSYCMACDGRWETSTEARLNCACAERVARGRRFESHLCYRSVARGKRFESSDMFEVAAAGAFSRKLMKTLRSSLAR